MKKALTLTIVANMTSNYSEGIGNIASVQKVFKNRKVYSMRSRESLKNAIMVQSGMYDDLETSKDGAAQKKVNEELIRMYWKVGEYLSKAAENTAFGDAYIDSVVKEIQAAFPGIKGFNRRGL